MTIAFLDIDLSNGEGKRLLNAVCLANPHLSNAAALLHDVFLAKSAWAPGLRFVGARAEHEDSSFSVGGAGLSLEKALTSCLGEAAERVSQIERPGDLLSSRDRANLIITPATRRLSALLAPESSIDGADWIAGDTSTNAACAVPADWCLRREVTGPLRYPGATLSTGCAAGANRRHAIVAAIQELIERDAAAAWWSGARLPTAIPSTTRMQDTVDALRQNALERKTWMLDISSELGCVVAALSCCHHGRDLSIGVSARRNREQAAAAALFEMGQMEIGLQLARLKESERVALSRDDERHIALASLSTVTDPRFRGQTSPTKNESTEELDDLKRLSQVFETRGIELMTVDLSRQDIGVPVIKAISPELQQLPGDPLTPRLRNLFAPNEPNWPVKVPLH